MKLPLLKKKIILIYLVMAGTCLFATACGSSEPVQKTGKYDFTDGKILGTLDAKDEEIRLGSTTVKKKSTVSNGEEAAITENKTLDEGGQQSLPEEIQKMVEVCNALNCASNELGTMYCTDPEYVWTAVHHYVMGEEENTDGIRVDEDVIIIEPETVKRYVYAMFGELKDVPDIPTEFEQSEEEGFTAAVSVGTDLRYRFARVKRPETQADVRSVISYTDGTKEMKVSLIDVDDGKEEVCFVYSLRDNGKDTSAASMFAYEITGQRYADTLTDMKMKGIPYIDMVMQKYPETVANIGNEDETTDATIEEVPYFCCNRENNKAVEDLNSRISYEIMEFAMAKEEKGQWHEICSYPYTNTKYVQVVVTYARKPSENSEGNLSTYNYDVNNSIAMGLEDALDVCQMKIEDLYSEVEAAYTPLKDGDVYDGAEYDGFFIKSDGTVDFYMTISINNSTNGAHSRIAAYNTSSKKFWYIFDEEESVVSSGAVDTYIPNLTHGKQDDKEK